MYALKPSVVADYEKEVKESSLGLAEILFAWGLLVCVRNVKFHVAFKCSVVILSYVHINDHKNLYSLMGCSELSDTRVKLERDI